MNRPISFQSLYWHLNKAGKFTATKPAKVTGHISRMSNPEFRLLEFATCHLTS